MAAILIVDDSPVSLRILSYTLRAHHAITTLERASDALTALRTSKYDLLITDLAMPEMDGLTLLRTVRADRVLAALPVIILTASGQDEDRIAARAAGVSGFLTKPASSHELIATVNALLLQVA